MRYWWWGASAGAGTGRKGKNWDVQRTEDPWNWRKGEGGEPGQHVRERDRDGIHR